MLANKYYEEYIMKKLLCLILALSLVLGMSLMLVSCSSDDEEKEAEEKKEIIDFNGMEFEIPEGYTLIAEDAVNASYVNMSTGSTLTIAVQKTIYDKDYEYKGPLYDNEADFIADFVNAGANVDISDVKIDHGVGSQVITYSMTVGGVKMYMSMTVGVLRNTVMDDGVEKYEYTTYTVAITSTEPGVGSAGFIK